MLTYAQEPKHTAKKTSVQTYQKNSQNFGQSVRKSSSMTVSIYDFSLNKIIIFLTSGYFSTYGSSKWSPLSLSAIMWKNFPMANRDCSSFSSTWSIICLIISFWWSGVSNRPYLRISSQTSSKSLTSPLASCQSFNTVLVFFSS